MIKMIISVIKIILFHFNLFLIRLETSTFLNLNCDTNENHLKPRRRKGQKEAVKKNREYIHEIFIDFDAFL